MHIYFRLEGKVAIITGGASGIGAATTNLFVENGALVIIADIDDELGTNLVQTLGSHIVSYKHCDVTIETDMEALIAFTLAKWGKLDIMISNVGVLGKDASEIMNVDMVNFHDVMSVNVYGMTLAIKHASKAMIEARTKGVIICTNSIASIIAGKAPLVYTVSKHALLGLMRASALCLGKYGIRVNCVSPSGVLTPLPLKFLREVNGFTSLSEHEFQDLNDSKNVLIGHSLSTLDVAQSILYLASNDASFVSGHNLVIDGGLSITCSQPSLATTIRICEIERDELAN